MVSFTCHNCQDVVKKPKVLTHASSCGTQAYSCVDCMQVFDLYTIKNHTTCISEEDKYQGEWKKKCTGNGNPKMQGSHSNKRQRAPGELDSDGDDMSAPPPPIRPPRPAMNLSDSDSDDDWASGSKKKKTAPAAAAAAKKEMKRSASSSPVRKPVAATRSPKAKASSPKQQQERETPFLLPRSTTSTDCIVPSFVLGTAGEIADIVKDVLVEEAGGAKKMKGKEVAKHLVDRYRVRIAKSVKTALQSAVELGFLQEDAEGNISCKK